MAVFLYILLLLFNSSRFNNNNKNILPIFTQVTWAIDNRGWL